MRCVCRGGWDEEPAHSPYSATRSAGKVLDALLLRLRAMPFTLRANLQCRMQGDNIDRGPQLEHLFNSDFMYLSPVKWVPLRRSIPLQTSTPCQLEPLLELDHLAGAVTTLAQLWLCAQAGRHVQ